MFKKVLLATVLAGLCAAPSFARNVATVETDNISVTATFGDKSESIDHRGRRSHRGRDGWKHSHGHGRHHGRHCGRRGGRGRFTIYFSI